MGRGTEVWRSPHTNASAIPLPGYVPADGGAAWKLRELGTSRSLIRRRQASSAHGSTQSASSYQVTAACGHPAHTAGPRAGSGGAIDGEVHPPASRPWKGRDPHHIRSGPNLPTLPKRTNENPSASWRLTKGRCERREHVKPVLCQLIYSSKQG